MTDSYQIQRLAEILKASENLCVFTGAGISCPSGIPDFRSADGLYNQKGGTISPEEIISHSFFLRHPKEFYQFYCEKMVYPEAKPNKAHRFFAELASRNRIVSIVTQNIDGLHTAAGSDSAFEL
ncbi:MAG: NAD-dependent protein deacylase, partial [Clostridia bacterium]|nr:NAD-dependent protein deacylase [Clostridia bacterium]